MSEINYSDIVKENRYDSEFYKKNFIEVIDKFLGNKKHILLGNEYKITDGEHGSVILQENGIKYLTAENIKNGFVDISSVRYVDESVNVRNARAIVKAGDILISIKGTLGQIAVAEEWLLPANMNRDVAILKNKSKYYSSEYIAIFMMSKFGYIQSIRGGSGGVQQMITLERLRKFIIPCVSDDFQKRIKFLYNLNFSLRIKSNSNYNTAEALLLEDIGLNNITPDAGNVNVKSFSDSFTATGRLDAEYYLPKYDSYLALIRNYRLGHMPLEEACHLRDKNVTPADNTAYRYIELSNIGKSGDVTGCTQANGADLPSRARRVVKTSDVVISSIEGSLNSCALITDSYDGALCSTGFYVINSEHVNAETLLVLFKSEPMQAILKQNCSGTILTAINKKEFTTIPVPLIDEDVQASVQSQLQESFRLRETSEALLDTAKRAVEIAIEQDEDTAQAYIQDICLSLGISLEVDG